MFMAPASPRAGTKRMRLWRAIASRIGMLWIEITPNTVVTPISASAWAMRSPTGSTVATGGGGAHMCGPGLIGRRGFPRQGRRRVALVQERLERGHGVNLAEEFQLQLLAPRLVRRIREGRHPSLAGIVDQDVAAPAPLLDR